MNLLEGLEKFGLAHMDTEHIFEDEKKEETVAQEKPVVKEEVHTEKEFLLEKSVRCPVCDMVFKTKMVKTGRVKRLEPDFDLRPRFQYIDTNKYDISSCPKCGYTAMNRYFAHLSSGQIKMIDEGVRRKFKPTKEPEPEMYTYDEAVERYKLALYNTLVKKGKASEKAFECLKISWLYRGKTEELTAAAEKDEKAIEESKKEEMLYYAQAYEGFIKAIASESFPMCGMEESTINLLVGSMAFKLEKYDIASRFVSMVLTSHAAGRSAKDRAMDMKEQIIKQLHNA